MKEIHQQVNSGFLDGGFFQILYDKSNYFY